MTSKSSGCFVLDCPFDEKEEAKQLGAKWDGGIRKWYIPHDRMDQLSLFPERWQPKLYLNCPYQEKDLARKAGAKWDNQRRSWYIMSHQSTHDFARWIDSFPTSSSQWESISSSPRKRAPIERSILQNKCKTEYDTRHSTPPTKKTKEDNEPVIDLQALPRVTSSMTIMQLSHELLFRNPSMATGLSTKSKSWFVSQLGENSIWTSSPQCTNLDLSQLKLVSSNSMTKSQLIHEIQFRSWWKPVPGLTTKSKQELLDLAGVGSIWMTSSSLSSAGKSSNRMATRTATTSNQDERTVASPMVSGSYHPPTVANRRESTGFSPHGRSGQRSRVPQHASARKYENPSDYWSHNPIPWEDDHVAQQQHGDYDGGEYQGPAREREYRYYHDYESADYDDAKPPAYDDRPYDGYHAVAAAAATTTSASGSFKQSNGEEHYDDELGWPHNAIDPDYDDSHY